MKDPWICGTKSGDWWPWEARVRTFDLVVIGAGIGGGSLVYNLLKQGFTGSILVLDRGETVATGASNRAR